MPHAQLPPCCTLSAPTSRTQPPAPTRKHPFCTHSAPAHPAPPPDDIRERVKALGFERHKLLVHVACGEKKQQAFHASSRCLWADTDGCASETFQSEGLFCTAQVFGLYFE